MDDVVADFFEGEIREEVLIPTQRLCKSIRSLIESKTNDSSEFVSKINSLWTKIKSEAEELDDFTANLRCIKSKISFKRICFSFVLEFEKTTKIKLKSEDLFNLIGNFYEGGIEKLRTDHSDLQDDLQLIHVEGIVQNLTDSTLITQYKDIAPEKISIKRKLKRGFFSTIKGYFPWLVWFPVYAANWKSNLKGDLIAGITVGIMAIPQSLAYAILAGFPPVYGLYCSIVPIFVYSFFGTSREIKIGATAVLATLVGETLSEIPDKDSMYYIEAGLYLSFISGLYLFLIGFLKLGFIINYLSEALLSGFISAAVFIIIMTQVKTMLGLTLPESSDFFYNFYHITQNLPKAHGPTLLVGMIGFVVLYAYDKLKKKYKPLEFIPISLVVIIITCVLSYAINFQKWGIKISGKIPSGLPHPINPVKATYTQYLFKSFGIVIVALVEHISIAKNFAHIAGYKVRPNQELIALGLANCVGAFFRSMPTTGSFSRTAVNAKAGAKSVFSNLTGGIVIMIAVSFLTAQLYYLPKVILSSIVIVAVMSICDFATFFHLFKINKRDCAVWFITFACTIIFGVEIGILCGFIASVVLLLTYTAFPRMNLLGRVPNKNIFRSVKRFPNALVNPEIAIIRIDAPLCFFNVSMVTKYFEGLMTDTKHPIKIIVMDWIAINAVDTSGIHCMESLIGFAQKRGIKFLYAQINGRVINQLQLSGLMKNMGNEYIFLGVGQRHFFR
eukprot:TRINITY_DN4081_c0_g2_i1.p1 TRINITY_DN4081_c0_g2~~TRINITY_DN4081_c0_g2_i1.p1  ORF type:complete len:736 (-),score=133.69 TRINITY_DN4081_c0_g2_i1:339-2522(-)